MKVSRGRFKMLSHFYFYRPFFTFIEPIRILEFPNSGILGIPPEFQEFSNQLKPDHITVFRYVEILRGCIVPFFPQRGNNTPPKDFNVLKNCNVLCFISQWLENSRNSEFSEFPGIQRKLECAAATLSKKLLAFLIWVNEFLSS